MNAMQAKVKEFHAKFMGTDPDQPTIPDEDVQKLRLRLIDEEIREFAEASASGDLPAAIKELCDLLYVVLGTANAYGIDIEPFFDEVHRSNMSKPWNDGASHKDPFGKVLKPPTYSPANIEGVLAGSSVDVLLSKKESRADAV
ncbi:MAG: hypothetical protein E6J26_03995 [Chloroflexi bacterium]|nr:MAG: hypothetical protein E6J26_03995 [Chloroflexota bacterium]